MFETCAKTHVDYCVKLPSLLLDIYKNWNVLTNATNLITLGQCGRSAGTYRDLGDLNKET
jgi:hypothetical protein